MDTLHGDEFMIILSYLNDYREVHNLVTATNYSKTSKLFKFIPNHNYSQNIHTFMHFSCVSGDFRFTQYLIKCKININSLSYRLETPLHVATKWNQYNIVKLLLNNNININHINDIHETALHKAVNFKRVDIFKLLLNYGADTTKKNVRGLTAYDLAKKYNLDEFLKLL